MTQDISISVLSIFVADTGVTVVILYSIFIRCHPSSKWSSYIIATETEWKKHEVSKETPVTARSSVLSFDHMIGTFSPSANNPLLAADCWREAEGGNYNEPMTAAASISQPGPGQKHSK